MTTPPASPSDRPSRAPEFDLLAEPVRRWVYDQGWGELRDIQEQAIPVIARGGEDVVIAAATAHGKTEAAFLPICSRLWSERNGAASGVKALYVGPLKALINDQFERLTGLCERLEIPVTPWHGDVLARRKAALRERPDGILLITPESLEAFFVRRGYEIAALLSALTYVVVDELHAFIGTERGAQLQSLLHRLERLLGRRVPRIGLSATLGDMRLAAEGLRPGGGSDVRIIVSRATPQDVKVMVRGYVDSAADPDDARVLEESAPSELAIASALYETLRGTNNIVFANRKGEVETYSDRLREISEEHGVPNEFFPHHGNLSKELREEVEAALKQDGRSVTAVATSTLELGIDVGRVRTVAQLGPPPTVASLRQRLGRSGRRGEAARLDAYVREIAIAPGTPSLVDELRPDLVQTIAAIELMRRRWCESPVSGRSHPSTLVQQILSHIAAYGGATATDTYQTLCGKGGPFSAITPDDFRELLLVLADREYISQQRDGTLLHGLAGERVVSHFSFYAAFTTTEEYRLRSEGRVLGTAPFGFPLFIGLRVVFAGRGWSIVSVDDRHRIVELMPTPGGRVPRFGGRRGFDVDDEVRRTMRRLLDSEYQPAYLDATARDLLAEARDTFAYNSLDVRPIVEIGRQVMLFPWRGSRVMAALAGRLLARGLVVGEERIALTVENATRQQVLSVLDEIATSPADPVALAATVPDRMREKYDRLLPEDLLNREYAARALDCQGAQETAKALLAAG